MFNGVNCGEWVEMVTISHKIEILPNNKQKTYFRKAFGCARLAYNWGLSEWIRRYENGENPDKFQILRDFNAIKYQKYPFLYQVPNSVTKQAIMNLGIAFRNFFKNLRQGVIAYPNFKRKKDNSGSFYIGGRELQLSNYNRNSKSFTRMPHNLSQKRQYLFVPRLGWVKMTEKLRLNGRIYNAVVSQVGSRFYVSFSVNITEEEYERTHKCRNKNKIKAVGIDLGLKTAMVLSDGIGIKNPEPYKKNIRKIKKLSRQLSKRVHPKTKEEYLNGVKKSNNYLKLSTRLCNTYKRVSNIRNDFLNKVSSIIVDTYENIVIEDLNVKTMTNSYYLTLRMLEAGFYEFRKQLEDKARLKGCRVVVADKYFPSSKICSSCGYLNKDLNLKDRRYQCPKCGVIIDRDYNAALNLYNICIGVGRPKLTSVDMKALLSHFKGNGIVTYMVEAEMQRDFRNDRSF